MKSSDLQGAIGAHVMVRVVVEGAENVERVRDALRHLEALVGADVSVTMVCAKKVRRDVA